MEEPPGSSVWKRPVRDRDTTSCPLTDSALKSERAPGHQADRWIRVKGGGARSTRSAICRRSRADRARQYPCGFGRGCPRPSVWGRRKGWPRRPVGAGRWSAMRTHRSSVSSRNRDAIPGFQNPTQARPRRHDADDHTYTLEQRADQMSRTAGLLAGAITALIAFCAFQSAGSSIVETATWMFALALMAASGTFTAVYVVGRASLKKQALTT